MTLRKFKPLKITKHLYQLGTPFFPMYLSIGDDIMLLEGGTGGTTGIIIEQINELGFDQKKIKYIALTHTHSDHIGSVSPLKKKWHHMKLLASATASKTLSYKKVIDDFMKMDRFMASRMKILGEIAEMPSQTENPTFTVDTIVEDGSIIDLGSDIKWKVIFIPGHSTCQVAFFEEKEGTMVIGDACGLHHPEMDVFWPNYFISLEQYCSSIRKLASIPAKRYALSHYGVIEKEADTFLKKAMKATEDYHLEMLERVYNGEDPNEVAIDKAEWIESFVVHMPFRIMEQMSKLLISRSQQDAEKENLFVI
jgi:2-aminobenzoylacetyl-CoA thioesterase